MTSLPQAWAALTPKLKILDAAVVLATWLGLLALSRIVSLASIGAAEVAPMAFFFCGSTPLVIGFAVVSALYVVLRHRANLTRLLKGTEPRIGRLSPGA
ncbi:hypothetical protein BH11PSE3_BH11PSE3_33540 [soil metagenome]